MAAPESPLRALGLRDPVDGGPPADAVALLWLSPTRVADAVAWQTERWTFAEVWASARKAAAALRRLADARPPPGSADTRGRRSVGIAINEGPALALAVLAVHLADCVIVPLDPCDPSERLAGVLSDAQAAHQSTRVSSDPTQCTHGN